MRPYATQYDPRPLVAPKMSLPELMGGGFERAISMFRTSYSVVSQSRPHAPDLARAVVWALQYGPSAAPHPSPPPPLWTWPALSRR